MNLYRKALVWLWERLTRRVMREGFAYLWMKHYLATEYQKCCDDPVLCERLGIEPK